MSTQGYQCFAEYYDRLTQNVDYDARVAYMQRLLAAQNHNPKLMLDLACGTGSMMLPFLRQGYDIYGVDASAEMLMIAREKLADAGYTPLLLLQKMQNLDLYGTVDTVLCCLDSLNHLPNLQSLKKTLARVFMFLEPGGFFLFDVNTLYKHRHVLGNNAFVYEQDTFFCVWQNEYLGDGKTQIQLDFFEEMGKSYSRNTEIFTEQAYANGVLRNCLTSAGFGNVQCFAEFQTTPPVPTTQRVYWLAQKMG